MWKTLKEAKTLKEIYEILGEKPFRNGFFMSLLCLTLLPTFMAVWNTLMWFLDGPDGVLAYDYRASFVVLSALSLLLFVFYLCCARPRLRDLWAKSRKNLWYPGFFLLLLWMGISTTLSEHPWKQLIGESYQLEGYLTYFAYAVFFLFGCLISDEEDRMKLLRFLSLTGLLMGGLMMLQVFNVPHIMEIFQQSKSIVFSNRNHSGYFLNISLICSAGLAVFEEKKSGRIYGIAASTGLTYALILNDTFGCYLASLITMLFLPFYAGWKGRKYVGRALILPAIFLSLSVLSALKLLPAGGEDGGYRTVLQNFIILSSDTEKIIKKDADMGSAGSLRMTLWIANWKAALARPVFGWGVEAFCFTRLPDCPLSRAHNEYLQWAAFGGFPALFWYLGSLILLATAAFRKLKLLPPSVLVAGLSVITYLISAFFGLTLFYTAPYLWMLLGLIAGEVSEKIVLPTEKGE